MFSRTLASAILGLLVTTQAYAQAPKVAVDIAPLHSLVAQVMDGVGEPDLLIRPEASPHSYSLRPSEAKALSDADLVFWIGEGLTPWLEKPLENIAGSATKIEMMQVDGTTLYDFREGATFEAHSHDHHDEDHHDKHEEHTDHHHGDHDAHHDHSHDDAHKHHEEGHDHAEHHHDGHDCDCHHHDGQDPHVWLDPKNAQVWLASIADELSKVDAQNAQTYQSNAKAAIARLDQLTKEIEQQTSDLKEIKFIVFHDAYQYFEKRFGLQAAGAISISDASDPSPARVEEIHQTVQNLKVTCVFTEPQFNPNLVNTVFEGSSVTAIGTMDPLGANIATGKEQYTNLLKGMLKSVQQCQL
ncbi:zinc ABC transporter substrate-binding protein [Vibrio panuliri]|uniref:High-affinity zinc uptake system protein ZnuA n=1 Tax=Vibrio panuliri TaxID=1381081 RepID=A0ABX3FB85_9VIBR|nr:zinc ABC transporter substrate-binding protein [Vibrio panuliri]KAB1458307.1 zinc transporter [Vibrio panuliri]OLQ86782.1 zinc transporter [Vibrio panuliri]